MRNAAVSGKQVVNQCPFCGDGLVISRLSCKGCDTEIDSVLPIPAVMRLPNDLQGFVMTFLRCRGNIREVEKALGISYPTVCKRLDLVNAALNHDRNAGDAEAPWSRREILERLERGDINVKEATRLLKAAKES